MANLKTKNSSEILKGNENIESQMIKLFGGASQILMEIYVLFYLCLFPLCMHDRYFDVLIFHFALFWKPTFAYGLIFIILGLLWLLCDGLYNHGVMRRRVLDEIKTKKFKIFNNLDIIMTVLILLLIISTAFAEYPYEAFWGDRGRNQGLLIWLMFYVMYWLVTRFYKFKKWHVLAYMGFASIVCIWGITNFFLVTYGMFENANELFKYSFVSSIGNINTYTGFTGMLMGVSLGMFVTAENWKASIYAYVVMIIACFAHIMGVSDNAVLSVGVILAATPLLVCHDYERLARYFIAAATYIGAMKITSLITETGIITIHTADPSVQITMGGKSVISVLIFVALGLAIGFMILHIRSKGLKNKSFLKNFKRIWWGLIIVVAVAIVLVLIMANTGLYKEILGPYSNLLVFNDSWGTGRGLVWRLGMEYWLSDTSLFVKLFGYGPDTFYIITMDRFMNIMQDAGYGLFDSAHNEYFEYFLTIGIFGLIAYLMLLFTSLRIMFKNENDSKVLGLAVLAYACQAVVNIAVPITTPVFMLLMFTGVVAAKETEIVRKS